MGKKVRARKLAAMESNATDTQIVEAGEEAIRPLAERRAHWSLFLPTLIVAALYGGVWLYLDASGRSGGGLSRLVFLALVVAPPVLLAYAFLRFYSAGVALTRKYLLVARGWPRQAGEQIPLEEVEAVSVRASWLARALGAGGIHIRLWDGDEIDVRDLADPEPLVEAIRKKLKVGR